MIMIVVIIYCSLTLDTGLVWRNIQAHVLNDIDIF